MVAYLTAVRMIVTNLMAFQAVTLTQKSQILKTFSIGKHAIPLHSTL